MVDEVRVTRLLRTAQEGLVILQRRASEDPKERSSETWLPAVKYAFITVIEVCVDLAQHICSTEHLGTPKSNGDAMRRLGIHNVLTPELAQAIGFRNVLVHDYVDIDDSIVIERLEDHNALNEFTRAIALWLEAQQG